MKWILAVIGVLLCPTIASADEYWHADDPCYWWGNPTLSVGVSSNSNGLLTEPSHSAIPGEGSEEEIKLTYTVSVSHEGESIFSSVFYEKNIPSTVTRVGPIKLTSGKYYVVLSGVIVRTLHGRSFTCPTVGSVLARIAL